MKRSNLVMIIFFSVSILCLASTTASASFYYNYTGNLYTTAGGVFNTTAMRITGYIEVGSAFAPNMSFQNITPLSYEFSDGVRTFTVVSSYSNKDIRFSTDDQGNIDWWSIWFRNEYGGYWDGIYTAYNSVQGCWDDGQYYDSNFETLLGSFNNNNLGTWTEGTPVPLPGALCLLGSGIMALVGFRKKFRNR